MKIIKRNGAEQLFDPKKIVNAITKANDAVAENCRMTEMQIKRISESVVNACEKLGRTPGVRGSAGHSGTSDYVARRV